MKEVIMKRIFLTMTVAFISLNILTSCNEYNLTGNMVVTEPSVVAVRVDPVVACTGCDITVSVFADDSRTNSSPFKLRIGNTIIESGNENEFKISLPVNLSEIFDKNIVKEYRSKGFVDVPVEVELVDSPYKAVKFFRIASSDYEIKPFDVNPEIAEVTYEIQKSAAKVSTHNYSTVIFKAGDLSGDVTFEVKEMKFEDIGDSGLNKAVLMEDYEFNWIVSGSTEELPELVSINSKTGMAQFSFKDSSGKAVFGKFRFTLVVKPKKSFTDSENARYGTDFHTFVFDTTGGTLETDD